MICDQFYPGGSDTAHVYTRWRDEDGNLVESIRDDFKPYFWIPVGAPEYQIRNALRRYPGSQLHKNERAKGLNGGELMRMDVGTPKDVGDMRGMFGKTWEADIRFPDRFLIDEYQDMVKWTPRKWWFDIECDTENGATTVIAVVGNTLNTPQVFAWADETTNCPYLDFPAVHEYTPGAKVGEHYAEIPCSVRGIDYNLHLFKSEREMQEAFIAFMQKGDPDMLIAHGGAFFDFPHMVNRFPKPERLSPVGIVRRPRKGSDHYTRRDGRTDYTVQPIVGRWCFDTSAPASSGTGFERVWKDSGHGQLPNRKLNTIAKTLGLGAKLTDEIEDMTVFNGWHEYWPEFVDYCLLDAMLLKEIDCSQNVTDFYIEMVRLCGVTLESTANVSHFCRGLFSRQTGLKAPTREKVEKVDLQGAEVGLACVTGRHQGVGVFDFKGLYPSIILGNNLCWTTKRSEPGEGIKQMENGTFWDQRKKGLLPKVITQLFEYRDECKEKATDQNLSSEERGAWRTTEKAIKRVMASLYGVTAHTGFGWADGDIAATVTSEGRRSIHMLDRYCEKRGFKTLYGHTDSAFVKVPLAHAQSLAGELTVAVQNETGNDKLVVELEEWMPWWLLVKKNRYVGKTQDGSMKVAGFELKASNSSALAKRVQETAFDLICDGAEEMEVRTVMRALVVDLKNGGLDPEEVCQTTRLGMPIICPYCGDRKKHVEKDKCDGKQYKTLSGASRAASYYNDNIDGEAYGRGDSVSWVYVKGVPMSLPDTDIVAFREASDLEGFTLDTSTVIAKSVKAKLKPTFEVLGWDVGAASGDSVPKSYW